MDKFQEIINSETPTLVDFFAAWCGPCKMMHQVLEQLKERIGDKARIVKIDVDAEANKPLAAQFQVRSIPTIFLFKNGEIIWKTVGATDLETLIKAIENA